MISFDVITLFPNLFKEHLVNLPFKKAVELGLISVNLHNLRDFTEDKHKTVDDKPFGGGVGMVLKSEPIFKAVSNIGKKKSARVITLSPRGIKYTQKKAKEYSNLSQIILICGRYEGIDERVLTNLSDEVISIGDFVLSGGELPALIIMESVVRLLPRVLEKEEASLNESFSKETLNGSPFKIEYPQYTRPQNFNGLKVPDVLTSGNHKAIEEWKKANSKPLI